MPNLTGPHLIIILVIVLLLFGAPKLPGLAKSIGQSMRIFRGEVKSMKKDDEADGTPVAEAQAPAAAAPAAPAAPQAPVAPPVQNSAPAPAAPEAPAAPSTDARGNAGTTN